ncbi:MAG TPA: protein kinase [Bryobacteraceae bacterium]|nr:protein kinase [Bryobacteraceae bacterium]
MDSQRWKQVDNLLNAALERPPAARAEFVRQACAGDQALEREVLSLLDSDREAGSFLDASGLPRMAAERLRQIEALYQAVRERGTAGLANSDPEIRREVEKLLTLDSSGRMAHRGAPETPEESTTTLLAGQVVSHFRILEMLGAGGMGVVYKAFDTRLDRHVALKFLPPHLRSHPELKQRLKEEARAASTLDHPNIVVIHDIGETPDGDLFIAMAFHEGATLRDRIRAAPGGLPVGEALQIARQIAAGLAKAHERGIFHRDIKPGNIIVANDGVTRIIDFGLAKSSDTTATLDGKAQGTPLYMSPEQAMGKPVDHRTDLWSFGAVLYEMLAGRPPFRGETQLQLMRAVVDDQPQPLRDLRRELPAEVESIVGRALQKEPSQRYQLAGQMLQDISAALAALESGGGSRTAAPTALASRRRMVFGAAALAVVLGGAVLAWRVAGRRHPVTSAGEYVQLTNFNDSAHAPALSPDGRMLAFFRGGSSWLGHGQVYVKMLPDGESRPLTDDLNAKYDPVFTPDGSRITYTAIEPKTYSWDTWTVPVLGGPPTRLMVNAAGLSWIGPDRVLFSEIMAGSTLHMGIVTAKDSRAEERPIYFPAHERAMAHFSWLSPDRSSVLIVEMNAAGVWQRCRVTPIDGKSAGITVGPDGACTAAAWSPDGEWIYLTVTVRADSHIWRQGWRNQAPYGPPEQITFGPTEEEGLAMAPDGKSLIAAVGLRQSSVWMHDSKGDRMVLQEGSASLPVLSADGNRLYYVLQRNNQSAARELWQRDLTSGASKMVLPGQRILDYDLSPDETQVAFTVTGMGGVSDIFVAAADRATPPRLVVRAGSSVSFGPSGQLFFLQFSDKANYLARIQTDGSHLERIQNLRITSKEVVSPDGEWVITGDADGVSGAFAVSVKGQSRRQLCSGECHFSWSPDRKYLSLFIGSQSSTEGTTYVIPVPHGIGSLEAPKDGFDGVGGTSGLRSIQEVGMALGPDAQSYAFTKSSFRSNLFRIPLH